VSPRFSAQTLLGNAITLSIVAPKVFFPFDLPVKVKTSGIRAIAKLDLPKKLPRFCFPDHLVNLKAKKNYFEFIPLEWRF